MQIARNYLLFAVVTASLCQRCLSHDCSKPLRNKVVYEGTSTSFEREYNNEVVYWDILPSYPIWRAFPFPMAITKDDGSVNEMFVDTYAVNQSQLTIFNSTIGAQGSTPYSTAGIYRYLYHNVDCETLACLAVIRSGPVCRSNSDTLFCQVDVTECENMDIKPIMTWKDDSGIIVKSETPSQSSPVDSALRLQRWISQVSVSDSDHKINECQLTFSKPDQSIFRSYAKDSPDFSTSCYMTTQTTTAWNCSSENLTNTVVKEGVTTTFPRLNNGQWQVFSASVLYNALKNITDSNDVVKPELNGTYAVSRPTLTIINSTLAPQGSMPYSTAGLYVLKDLNQNCTKAANLIVIRSGPVCACNATNPNNVALSCSVIFAESSVQPNNPVFTWKKSDGVQVKEQQPIPTQIEPSIKRSMSQLSIASNDAATYECQMTFSTTPKAPFTYVNPKAPSFNESCSVSCV